MPRKKVTGATEQPQNAARSKAAAKTTRARKTAAPAAAKKPAPTRAPRKAAASRSATAKTPRASRSGTNGHGNELLRGKTAQDYAEAKRALGALWEDITRQTYTTFDIITRRVEKSYAEARKNVTEGDVRYALDKTQGKLKSIAKSGSQAVIRLGKQAKLLYEVLRDATAGKFKIPWLSVAAITAALLYFISPLDIIPDFIPGIGWIDDALVISLAISAVRVDLLRYVKEHQLDPAKHGL